MFVCVCVCFLVFLWTLAWTIMTFQIWFKIVWNCAGILNHHALTYRNRHSLTHTHTHTYTCTHTSLCFSAIPLIKTICSTSRLKWFRTCHSPENIQVGNRLYLLYICSHSLMWHIDDGSVLWYMLQIIISCVICYNTNMFLFSTETKKKFISSQWGPAKVYTRRETKKWRFQPQNWQHIPKTRWWGRQHVTRING